MSLLPPVPIAAFLLSLGALGGTIGARSVAPETDPVGTTPVNAPQASAQAAIVASGGGGVARRASDGLFYVRAMVNGRPVRFLVDTGASVVVLRAADAAAVGVNTGAAAFNGRMQTASGTTSMAWTRLDEVRVGERSVTGLRAAVVKDGLAVSLLGANMLSRLGSVRIEGDRLELR